ncbi:MAG: hypothetical protein L3J78_01730, partial [Thermoplasmata archaeon]|nr:hypothetical protein [Thermoplasmata archaeon]
IDPWTSVVPALFFVVLLMVHVELRILADRFAPLYDSTMTAANRDRLRAALVDAVLRLAVAASHAVVEPMFAADLAATGVVSLTTLPSAMILAAALVAVVLLVAVLPGLERTDSRSSL